MVFVAGDVFPRVYDTVIAAHLGTHRQMAFVSGPRQVGKTTTARGRASSGAYLSWDDPDDRRRILRGPSEVAGAVGIDRLAKKPPVVVFDEIHKHARYRSSARSPRWSRSSPNARRCNSSTASSPAR